MLFAHSHTHTSSQEAHTQRPTASVFRLPRVQLARISEGATFRDSVRPAPPRAGPAAAGWAPPALAGPACAPPSPPPAGRPTARPGPAPAPPRPRLIWPLGRCRGRRPAGRGRAMSHGAGLVRTTCTSSSAFGPGAGAGQRGAGPSEGLLDPVYPRTQGALLKVAQMVREARGAGPGPTEWPRGKGSPGGDSAGGWSGTEPAGAPSHGRAGAAPLKSSWRKASSRRVGCTAPALRLSPTPRPLLR